LRALYRFFRSVRLAVVLILIIAVLSILSTLIPQGKDAVFYFHKYGAFWAHVILRLRFDDFFHSLTFLIPVGLFFINLAVCTVDRFVRREHRKARRRHGPDLIHVGLLLLIIGAMFSVFGRREGMVYMGEGDEIRLPGDYVLRLLEYRYEEYEDGRPKDWISTVQVRRNGEVLASSVSIEVNKPLKIGGINVYQTTFAREDRALLTDQAGNIAPIRQGQGLPVEGGMAFFRGNEDGAAVFERWEKHARTGVYRVEMGESIGAYTLAKLDSREVTGLTAVKDPGYIPVVISLVIVAAGLTLTFVQKSKDKGV
jgi:cytochrome c biogenesis protein